MAKTPKQKIINKKHKARVEKDRKQRQRMLIIFGSLFVLVLLVLLYGVLDQTVLAERRPVAKVDETVIRTNEFQKMVKFQRFQLNQQAIQYANLAQLFGGDAQSNSYINSMLQQIQSQMENTQLMGSQVLDTMINQIVIEKYAEANNISVSQDELDKALQEDFGYFPEGTPTPANTATPFATSTMNPTQYAIITATPVVEPTTIETSTETAVPTESVEATPSATEEVVETPVDQATATPMPTATEYTEDAYQDDVKNMVDSYGEIGFSKDDIYNLYRNQLLYQKVYDQITSDVPTEAEQVWARHILVSTIEDALAVEKRLQEGEDWAAIAAEVSQDTSNKDVGGDLGWFGKGVMDPAFEEAAFALNVGEISDPVQSQFGYHIIQLLGKEVRPLDSTQLKQAKDDAFSTWLTSEKENHTIEKYDSVWQNVVPVEPTFIPGLIQ